MSKPKIGIIGASGFTGLELIRSLSTRTDLDIHLLSSRSLAGKKVSDQFPEITNRNDLTFSNIEHQELSNLNLDLVFLAMENGKAMEIIPHISCKVVDLSADFRFTNIQQWEQIYQMKHASPHTKAVYGLPELFYEAIKKANVVANPGCFATASLLSLLPLQHTKNIERAICDGKTGVSGAGRRSTEANNYNFLSENIMAYKITNHRHEAEIQQFFPFFANGNTKKTDAEFPISFTPHIVPMIRGMLVTTHIFFKNHVTPSSDEIFQQYKNFYSTFPGVEVTKNTPEPREVRMSNRCRIGGFETDKNGRLVIISVIDNLGKGASLQAIQNMELMLGL